MSRVSMNNDMFGTDFEEDCAIIGDGLSDSDVYEDIGGGIGAFRRVSVAAECECAPNNYDEVMERDEEID